MVNLTAIVSPNELATIIPEDFPRRHQLTTTDHQFTRRRLGYHLTQHLEYALRDLPPSDRSPELVARLINVHADALRHNFSTFASWPKLVEFLRSPSGPGLRLEAAVKAAAWARPDLCRSHFTQVISDLPTT